MIEDGDKNQSEFFTLLLKDPSLITETKQDIYWKKLFDLYKMNQTMISEFYKDTSSKSVKYPHKKEEMEKIDCLIVDIDDSISFNEFKEIYSDYEWTAYPTISNYDNDNWTKFRVILPVLSECIEYAISNSVDVVLFSELSRCGRAVWEVLDTIRTLKDNGINAYFQKEGLSLFSEDGSENVYLAVMLSVLCVCSQIERENIYYRLQSGRKVFVDKNLAETGKSGLERKVGYRKPIDKKREEYKETLKLLRAGYPIRKVAKLTDVSESTVKRLKREFCI